MPKLRHKPDTQPLSEEDKRYQDMYYAASILRFDPEKIESFIRQGVGLSNPRMEAKMRDSFIANITRRAPEGMALKLLQLVYEKDPSSDKSLIKTVNPTGITLIYSALRRWEFDLADFLIDTAKVPVDAIGRSKVTPLYIFVTLEHITPKALKEPVQYLINKGANPLFFDKRGQCLFDLVPFEEIKDILRGSKQWGEAIKQHELKQKKEDSLRQRKQPPSTQKNELPNLPEETVSSSVKQQPSSYTSIITALYLFFGAKDDKEGYTPLSQTDDSHDKKIK